MIIRLALMVLVAATLALPPAGCNGDDGDDIETVCDKLIACGKKETQEGCRARIQGQLDRGEVSPSQLEACADCSAGKSCDDFEKQCTACD